MARQRFVAILLLNAAAFLPAKSSTARAQAPPSIYDVQSVYLFDFAKFVRWPTQDSHATLVVCVAGPNVYVDTLTKIVAGEQIDGHALAVRSVRSTEDVNGCGILFIGTAEKEHLDSLLTSTAGKPVLTVSDIPGFLDHGGMIQFIIVANRVRFTVDLRPVSRSGIDLNSELLKVAATVKPSGGGKP